MSEKLTPEQFVRAKKLAVDLTTIKAELGQLGLFKAMHAMDLAVGPLGFEIAEKAPHD